MEDRHIDRCAKLWSLRTQADAIMVDVLAMKTMNEARADQGYAQAYGEETFQERVSALEALAREMLTI